MMQRFSHFKHPAHRGVPDQCGVNIVKADGIDTIRPRHRPGKNRPILPGKPIATMQAGVFKAV